MGAFGTADGIADDSRGGGSSGVRRLIFHVQPVGAASAAPLSVQPVVRALTDTGALNTSFTGTVALTLTGAGALSGTASVAAVGGVATFTDLVITGAGASNLVAAASGYAPATSSAITTS